jgi:hypothetical protein
MGLWRRPTRKSNPRHRSLPARRAFALGGFPRWEHGSRVYAMLAWPMSSIRAVRSMLHWAYRPYGRPSAREIRSEAWWSLFVNPRPGLVAGRRRTP